jgi:uncharacterized protein YqgV (UPF0045/DUF77 family)
MKITVEISNYPLHNDFIPPIQDFIERLNRYPDLKIRTNITATHIIGDIDTVMSVLNQEMKSSFEKYGSMIFVAKFLNADLSENL